MNRAVGVFLVAICCLSQRHACCQEQARYLESVGDLIRLDLLRYPSDEKLLIESSKEEREQTLYAFCQRGILAEIGLARYSSWTGNADGEIRGDLLKDSAFKNSLVDMKAAPDYGGEPTAEELAEPDRKTADLPRNRIWWRYQPHDGFRKAMLQEMSDDQRTKLPLVYLELEGMMALCRPEFIKLFETQEKRMAIRKIVEDAYEARIEPMQSLMWRVNGHPAMLTLRAHQRRACVDLDCKIVLELSSVERDRLVECVERSNPIAGKIPMGSRR